MKASDSRKEWNCPRLLLPGATRRSLSHFGIPDAQRLALILPHADHFLNRARKAMGIYRKGPEVGVEDQETVLMNVV
jgi:hypothetical protein